MSYGHSTIFYINFQGSYHDTVVWNDSSNRWEGEIVYIRATTGNPTRWQIRRNSDGAILAQSGDSDTSISPADEIFSNYSVVVPAGMGNQGQLYLDVSGAIENNSFPLTGLYNDIAFSDPWSGDDLWYSISTVRGISGSLSVKVNDSGHIITGELAPEVTTTTVSTTTTVAPTTTCSSNDYHFSSNKRCFCCW